MSEKNGSDRAAKSSLQAQGDTPRELAVGDRLKDNDPRIAPRYLTVVSIHHNA